MRIDFTENDIENVRKGACRKYIDDNELMEKGWRDCTILAVGKRKQRKT